MVTHAHQKSHHITNKLDSLAFLGLACAVLLIGGITFDQRLEIVGIPLDVVVVITAFCIFVLCSDTSDVSRTLVLILPFLVLAPSMFWMQREVYGATKYLNFVACSGLAGGLIFLAAQRVDAKFVGKAWVFLSSVLLIAAVVYKLKNGFFDRETRFLLNGPIVFGRIMGIAVVVGVFVLRGWTRTALCFAFFCAVIWTGSKGPVLSLFFVAAVGALLSRRWKSAALVVASLVTVIFLSTRFEDSFADVPLVGREMRGISGLLALMDSSRDWGANEGSIGTRQSMWIASTDVIATKPFGVGMGDWATVVHQRAFDYPHNIVLEILSESGVLLTTAAVTLALLLYRARIDWFGAACLYLFAAQQVSGDLLDFRFFGALLVASALLIYEKRPSIGVQSPQTP